MINFEEFKDVVVSGIIDCLPESFSDAEVNLQGVIKNNGMNLTGLTIRKNGSNITPTIYLESYYESYRNGTGIDEILNAIAEVRLQHEAPDIDVSNITNLALCEDKIFPRIVNAESNEEMLKNRPHILVEDLAITFFIRLDESMTVPITNSLAEGWNVDAEDLRSIAINNQNCAEDGTFKSMTEVLLEMMGPDAAFMLDMMPSDEKMFVLSNNAKMFGASILLNQNMMEKVIERVGEDFYILPSSIHEVLIVPGNDICLEDLKEMVMSVNSTEVSAEDKLSDSVYIYRLNTIIKVM